MKKLIILTLLVTAVLSLCSFITKKEDPLDKVGLGKKLFFDKILSSDRSISCASCHKPEFAFADNLAKSKGVRGRRGTRNAPSTMNMLLQQEFFWDGRAGSLEEQALAPIENPVEMNLPLAEAIRRLKSDTEYVVAFRVVFGEEPTPLNLAQAIAAFERTLETNETPFDEWKYTGNDGVVSDAVRRGFVLFNGKGKCIQCHFGADLTAREYRNIGLFNGRKFNDSGRASITHLPADIGKFKTGSLRNIELTAPYMHNGVFKTLDQVIDFYNDPAKIVPHAIGRDTILAKPLALTREEKKDIKAFLLALTDKRFK